MKPVRLILNIIIMSIAFSVAVSCGDPEEDSRRAAARQETGDSLLDVGDYRHAMEAYVEAFRLSESSGNDSVRVRVLGRIGRIYAYHDDFQKGASYYQKGLKEAFSVGDSTAIGDYLYNLVLLEKTLGDKEKERHYAGLYSRHQMTDPGERAYYGLYLRFLGLIEAGRDGELHGCLKEMLRLIAVHNIKGSSGALLYNHMGMRYMERGMPDSALISYRAALRELGKSGDPNRRQAVYTNLCRVLQAMGETDSLAFYQGKLIAASDSIFSLRNFNAAKGMLDTYEEAMTQRHITRLEKTALYAGVGLLLIGIVMVVIIIYSRKVNQARLALVRRNETLMKEEERLGRRITVLENRIEELEKGGGDSGNEGGDDDGPDEAPKVGLVCARTDGDSDVEVDVEETARRPLLGDELRARLAARIMEIVADKSTVFNPDYNIGMLAVQLGTNTRYVTEVVRGLGASNFRNFINEYRIREACRRLADKEHYGQFTISAIAQEVGFSSDSGFFLAFKKVMGMTPAQYRKLSRFAQES